MRKAGCLALGMTLLQGADPVSGIDLMTRGPLSQAEALVLPASDGDRFALGAAQVLRAVEHLGQGLYRHGAHGRDIALFRMPVPPNPNPEPIDYEGLRTLLRTFQGDLARAQATLHRVKGTDFKVALRLDQVKLDLQGNGASRLGLLELVRALRHEEGAVPEVLNGPLDVAFDAADAAWLEGYTHLLMGLADLFLAVDLSSEWDDFAPKLFEAPVLNHKWDSQASLHTITWADRQALGRMRRHWVAMAGLSRETWKWVMAEQDDDREWLPSPTQKGVLGVPVRPEMVQAWLHMIGSLESVLEGRALLPAWGSEKRKGYAFDLKAFLDQPPAQIHFDAFVHNGPGSPYLRKGTPLNPQRLQGAANVFGGNFMGMALWFN